jgi:hypothetical protein
LGDSDKYTSRNGTPLIIYNFNAGGDWCLHGAYKSGDEWKQIAWNQVGQVNRDQKHNLDVDWEGSDELA